MALRSRTQAVYVISVAAELAGMHPQTLRIYERRGLLLPARTQGGNRRYSDADIERLRRIADLAEAGMNLEGIRRVMQLEAENERLRSELADAKKRAAERGGRRGTAATSRSGAAPSSGCSVRRSACVLARSRRADALIPSAVDRRSGDRDLRHGRVVEVLVAGINGCQHGHRD